MKKFSFGVLSLFILLIAGGSSLFAQSTQNVTFQVNLAAFYNLSIGESTITFTDVPPAVVNPPPAVSIGANENPVSVRAFAIVFPGDDLQLTVRATGDLTKGSGSDINISAITWTVSGSSGYQPGALQAGTDVTAGSWTGAFFHWHEGTFSYSFARNYQTQEPGAYQATATYTLSSV